MKLATVVAAVAFLAACGSNSEFKNSLPNTDTVKVKVPQASGQALQTQTQTQGLLGQTAALYQFTVDVSGMLNGATANLLNMIQTVTTYPPTSETTNGAVWGPFTDPLSPNTYKLTVTKTAPGTYTYELDGKPKTQPDSAFLALVTGQSEPTADGHGEPVPGFGSGSFTLNWDNAHTLPQNDGNVGTAAFQYSHPGPSADATVDITFTNVLDKSSGQLINAKYAYLATAANGGKFQFSEDKDVITGPNGAEHWTVESRWEQSGAGRADAKLTGGDVPNPPGQATANECWDTNFLSIYLNASYDPTLDYGQESVCAFIPAEYSSL